MKRSSDRSPARLNLEHLKKQAKELIRLYRRQAPDAFARFRSALPAAAGRSDADIAALNLRLHDAQSCVARDLGFASWPDLRRYVEAQLPPGKSKADRVRRWLQLVYAGDVDGTVNRANPRVAAQILTEDPGLAADDPYLGCAIGDEDAMRKAAANDPAWVNRPGGPLKLPPLVAVTHSSLLQIPEFRPRLHRCARLLLQAGADPDQRIGSRWPPGSLDKPDDSNPLSALYGAAGRNHDLELTKLLLEAGANPNDNESLYHSLEGSGTTGILLEHGARIAGTNAMYKVLDTENVAALELLLRYGGDPNEPPRNAPITDYGSPLMWAIRRRRSRQCIATLLDAGANPQVTTPDGVTAYELALRYGLSDVADLLRERTGAKPLPDDERFIAACAGGDEPEARRIQAQRPDLPGALSPQQLRLLPELAAAGGDDAVRLMVKLGWPIAARGGDWDASALNHAVFRGNAELTRFLLVHGAQWTEQHGFGDNACGSLSWASCNEPSEDGDWAACAQALLDHGLPHATPDRNDPEWVLIGGRRKLFSDEVRDVLLGAAG
ncbi:ankyrin repeat domain-containing protein [Bradyrhizobium genosp. L]|uniref:ankyrin repeat domain-containing protein n=1 Tax=Bradyrhizobium genosp. L TaxID=83637 RepID=UPI0018A3351D|nr:ankyrin repeat domain-containing protein [Bradyrhizobium genosp. L]QPF86977.1 ankyrin repeat domain-containing protein [Bradyrhizobium genosp. L]